MDDIYLMAGEWLAEARAASLISIRMGVLVDSDGQRRLGTVDRAGLHQVPGDPLWAPASISRREDDDGD